jgi:hypothetical protein
MVRDEAITHSACMTSPSSTPSTAVDAAPAARAAAEVVVRSCCRRPMSTIEVTTRGSALTLHSCTACGRHLWEKDGQTADRADLLDGVKLYLEQPRLPTKRRSSKRS